MSVNSAAGLIFASSRVPITYAYLDTGVSSSSAAEISFSSQPMGDAAMNRSVLIVVGSNGSTERNITSMSIDGVAASLIFRNHYGGGGEHTVQFWVANIPNANTNTSGTLVQTWDGTFSGTIVRRHYLYSVYNLQSNTAYDIAADNTTNAANSDLAINALGGGLIIGATIGNVSPNASWTNLTEDDDNITSTVGISCASAPISLAQLNRAVSVSLSNNQTAQACAAISMR